MARRPILIGLERDETNTLTEFIHQCARKGNVRMRKRGQAVYLSHEGKRVPQIARELECSENSVYSWLKDYREKGIAGLEEPTHSNKLTAEQLDKVMGISHWVKSVQPESRGAKMKRIQSRWSFRKMTQWIKDNWNIKISHERLRQMVRRRLRE